MDTTDTDTVIECHNIENPASATALKLESVLQQQAQLHNLMKTLQDQVVAIGSLVQGGKGAFDKLYHDHVAPVSKAAFELLEQENKTTEEFKAEVNQEIATPLPVFVAPSPLPVPQTPVPLSETKQETVALLHLPVPQTPLKTVATPLPETVAPSPLPVPQTPLKTVTTPLPETVAPSPLPVPQTPLKTVTTPLPETVAPSPLPVPQTPLKTVTTPLPETVAPSPLPVPQTPLKTVTTPLKTPAKIPPSLFDEQDDQPL